MKVMGSHKTVQKHLCSRQDSDDGLKLVFQCGYISRRYIVAEGRICFVRYAVYIYI